MRIAPWVGALVLVTTAGCGSGSKAPSSGADRYEDPGAGWSLTYPANWRLQTFDGGGMRFRARGALVSSLDRRYVRPGADTIAWKLADLPKDSALVSFSIVSGAGGTDASPTSFPLSIDKLMLDDSPAESYDAPFARRFMPVFASWCANYCLVEVWIGPDAPEATRKAVDAIVASIEPP